MRESVRAREMGKDESHMSHPDSRSDPIGGFEPSSGRETIY